MTGLNELDLNNNYLDGTIPTQIGLLNVESLDISGCSFVGSIPTQIGKLTNLIFLGLFSNNITGTIPAQFQNLTRIQHLDLSNNGLYGSIPTQICDLENLIDLKLFNNKFTGGFSSCITTLSYHLLYLDISFNQLTGTIPTQIVDLTNLVKLHLASNKLSGTIPTQLGNMNTLQSLDISDNSLSGTVPSQFGNNLIKDQRLDLSYNQLSGDIIFSNKRFSFLNLIGNVEILVCKVETDLCFYDGLSNCLYPQNNCGEECCWPEYDKNCPLCSSGYVRLKFGGNCTDIDECDMNKGICGEKQCVNKNGSFDCVECLYGQILVNEICEDSRNQVQILGTIIGCVLFVILMFLVIGKALHKYFKISRILNILPTQVNWSFLSASSFIATSKGWTWLNDNFMILTISPNTQEWTRVMKLIPEDFDQKLIKKTYAINNPKLVSQFVLSYKMLNNQSLINKFDNDNSKDWVLGKYLKYVRKFKWNLDIPSPIIPVFHGTDFSVSKMICENGFANLSLLDVGFYGKGIYFTSSIEYALQYCFGKSKPTIIVSFILPGNPFPVTENPNNLENNLCGSPVPVDSKYDSHFVVTNIKGYPVTNKEENSYDEFVIGQEPKIVPAFLLVLGDT